MAFEFKQNFNKGVNLDADELRIPQNAAQFIKNMSMNMNANPNAPALAGQNEGVYTPIEGTAPLSISLPSGNNYCIGFYSSEQTNEGYFFVYNSSNNHSVWVISGDTGAVTKVYQNTNLNFQLQPQYFISEGRCALYVITYISPVTGLETKRKFLGFTDNFNAQRFISSVDSINTAGFTTSASGYFNFNGGVDQDTNNFICLAIAPPLHSVAIAPIGYDASVDLNKQNKLINRTFQFRVKFIDVFNRESEHGIISDRYITTFGSSCLQSSTGNSRRLNLSFDAGNPFVDKIQVEYRNCYLNTGTVTDSQWYLYDTIDKWDNSQEVEWYDRVINPEITYDNTNNTITYEFDGTKEAIAIDATETDRLYNPIPLTSSSQFAIGNTLALANNVRDFEPLNPDELSKISITLTPPPPDPCGAPHVVNVSVYAIIYNPYSSATFFGKDWGYVRSVWHYGATGTTQLYPFYVRNLDDAPSTGSTEFNDQADWFDQTLMNNGWVGYLAGTPYSAISIQVSYDFTTGVETEWNDTIPLPTNGIILQKWTFKVLPGKYIFRISGNKTIQTANYSTESTTVFGHVNTADFNPSGGYEKGTTTITPVDSLKETIVNVCAGADIVLRTTPLVIYDFLSWQPVAQTIGGGTSAPPTDIVTTTVVKGYVREDDISKIPFELAKITSPGGFQPGNVILTNYSDHNGFFFGASSKTNPTHNPYLVLPYYDDLKFLVHIDDCSGSDIDRLVAYGSPNPYAPPASQNVTNAVSQVIGEAYTSWIVYGYGNVDPFVANPTIWPEAGRRRFIGRIYLCGVPATGIPGIPMIVENGPFVTTDTDGNWNLIVHNRYDAYTSATDTIIQCQGNCWTISCDGTCTPCFPDLTAAYIACGGASTGCTSPQPTTRAHCFGSTQGTLRGLNLKGPQMGGTYGVGITMYDVFGRAGFVQQNDLFRISVPTLLDTKTFNFSTINYTIDGSISLPSWVKYISFFITQNTSFSNFFTWPIDKIEFVDGAGNINIAEPQYIRLFYGSLNQYNTINNFSTNTQWDFITVQTNTQSPGATNSASTPVTGDIIEFYQNGDGVWFPTISQTLVRYDLSGSYLEVDFNETLRALVSPLNTSGQGALIRVIRPRDNTNINSVYYEMNPMLTVNGGVPISLSGTVDYFDSYLLNRVIPIPVPQPSEIAAEQAALPAGSPNIIPAVFSTIYPYLYEGPAPSDFWGYQCFNRGRINTKNPYERQKRIGMEIAQSATLLNKSNFNGLSYFGLVDPVSFPEQEWGNITVVLPETGICLVICDSNHFFIYFQNSQLKTGPDGSVITQAPYGDFTAPQRKPGQSFGCISENINTIRRYLGIVYWLDAKGRLIKSNYSESIDVSTEDVQRGIIGGYSGYLKNKISTINLLKSEGANFYFLGGIDPKTKEYFLTSFQNSGGGSTYINSLGGVNLDAPETLAIDLNTGILKGFPSFTPEYYGLMPGFFTGENFLSFKSSMPYKHHAGVGTPPLFANFYGTQCACLITHVVNIGTEKVKRFFNVAVYTKQNISGGSGVFPNVLFIANPIFTEKGQQSRLSVQRWDIRDGFQVAAYICDLNTPADPNLPIQTGANVILDGNPLIGRWLSETIITQAAYAGTYFEVSAVVVYGNSIEKSAD